MMNLLGIHLTVLIGETAPIPAPPELIGSLKSVEVVHSDEGRSGFQMTFEVGRPGYLSLDYTLLNNPLLRPFNRVVLKVTFNATRVVLMDGIIVDQQLSLSSEPGASTLVVKGEDITVMMDLEEKSLEYPGLSDALIVKEILGKYPQFNITLVPGMPDANSLQAAKQSLPIERVPTQQCTDLEQLQKMAGKYGYVFYITSGPEPLANAAYWGPPNHLGTPQAPLMVNMGPNSNVDTISFGYNSLAATEVSGTIQDRETNRAVPIQNERSTRSPLSGSSGLEGQRYVKKRKFRAKGRVSQDEAKARAQGETEASVDSVVEVQGQLDALRYGSILHARGIVCLKGAGLTYDGLYYVKSVTHVISKGSYKQNFILSREGTMTITPGGCPRGMP